MSCLFKWGLFAIMGYRNRVPCVGLLCPHSQPWLVAKRSATQERKRSKKMQNGKRNEKNAIRVGVVVWYAVLYQAPIMDIVGLGLWCGIRNFFWGQDEE